MSFLSAMNLLSAMPRPVSWLAGLVLLALFPACSRVSDAPIDNLSGGRIFVMGHAGSGFESALNPFPPNTLTSIRKTLEGFNADGIEIDIQLSHDSTLILYHDGTLESMTECTGYIYDQPASAVTACRYRTDFNSHILQDERVLLLTDILERYKGSVLEPRFDFDLKLPEGPGLSIEVVRAQFARRLAAVVNHYGLLNRVNFMSPDAGLLLAIRRELPTARVILDSNDFEPAFAALRRDNLTGIVAGYDAFSADQIRQLHAAGKEVTLYKVILRSEILEAVNKNPDAIQTDNIPLLQQILSARYGH